MIVPPFMPEPIEIHDNVADQRFKVMVRFIKVTVMLHVLTVLLVVLLGYTVALPFEKKAMWLVFFGSLVVLSIMRGAVKGRHWEMYCSAALLPITLLSFSQVLPAPAWSILVGPLCALIFVLLCGQDLSFLGMFMFALLGSLLTIGITSGVGALPSENVIPLCLGTAAYLAYLVYDLAMITRRRRKDEALGAAVDLYRDLLNFLTYPIRVWNHWRKHRIWSVRIRIAETTNPPFQAALKLREELKKMKRNSRHRK